MRFLSRDLRRNGGVIDQIILALWQYTEDDLHYIRRLMKREETNNIFELRDFSEQKWGPSNDGADPSTNRMVRLYQSLDELGTVYVKIDDDVVYVARHAIADMV